MIKQKELEGKNKEREDKRERLNKRLEEKKRTDAKKITLQNALEEDKRRIN